MPRSSTTALYTRVDNSFSNPVVGTTISPTHADTFFDDVEASMNAFLATSASSVAIGTGAKTFTVASDIANKVFIAGTFVHIYSRADTADYMFGTVTSYSTSTGDLVTDITATGGSGTNTDWNIYQAGARGATGATGATGPEAWTEVAAWLTATAYVVGPPASVVTEAGETYVCLESHTSGTFATDLAAVKWIKVAAKGDNGAVAVNGTPTLNQMTAWHDATTIKAATPGTDYLDKDTTSLLTVGYTQTSFDAGTKSSGTYTPSAADGGFQHATNNGAHTLAPPTASSSIVVEYLNGASAGAVTTSGFTKVYGAFDTTNTNKFICNIIKTNSYSLLQITPLQ